VTRYTPTTTPRSRLPHRWPPDGSSLYDRLGPGFTLLGPIGVMLGAQLGSRVLYRRLGPRRLILPALTVKDPDAASTVGAHPANNEDPIP
jgi:hypothetical protein